VASWGSYGAGPTDPVRIDANYLDDPQDLKDLAAGLTRVREIGNSAALRAFAGREVAPGALDTSDLERFFRDGLVTFWRQCGTAKMGRDAMSVHRFGSSPGADAGGHGGVGNGAVHPSTGESAP
jgi:choline dehydrogenase-like flavoprotein